MASKYKLKSKVRAQKIKILEDQLGEKVKECDSRQRTCEPYYNRLYCEGESNQEQDCNVNPCPVWTEWSEWTVCSVTCGGGKRSQTRQCVDSVSGEILPDSSCGNESSEVLEDCNTNKCPGN